MGAGVIGRSVPETHGSRGAARDWLEQQVGEPVSPLRLLSMSDQNMVALASTASGREVVVRMSPNTDVEARARTLNRCRAQGLPVPDVVGVGQCAGRGALVLEYISGVPLNSISDPDQDIMTRVGRVLGRLHSTPVQGAGPLDGDGNGSAPSWAAAVLAVRSQAVRAPGPRAREAFDRALQCLEELRSVEGTPVLLHGDWAPRHVIIDADGHPWIIDLDDALIGDCAWDLACWEYQSPGARYGLSSLMSGYRQVRGPGPDMARRMRLHRIAVHVAVLTNAWAGQTASSAWEPIVEKIRSDVAVLAGWRPS